MSVTAVARVLSIVGHPAVLMPVALVWAALERGAPARVLHTALGFAALIVAAVGVYSVIQVRAGRWAHVDASAPRERRQLTRFLMLLLFGAAGALWLAGQPPALVSGLAVSGALVAFAHLTRRWLKVSLHAAFAVYAAALLWPSPAVFGLGLGVAAAVAWSRCALRRHTPPEVLIGLLAGAAAGLAVGWLAR